MEQLSTLAEELLVGVAGLEQKLETLIAVRLEFWGGQKSRYRMLLTVGRAPEHRKQTHAVLKRAASLLTLLEESVRSGDIRA